MAGERFSFSRFSVMLLLVASTVVYGSASVQTAKLYPVVAIPTK
jgi:hypothetical protein